MVGAAPKTASERKHAAERHGLRKNYTNATVLEGINNKTVYAQYSNPVSSEWCLLQAGLQYKGGNGLMRGNEMLSVMRSYSCCIYLLQTMCRKMCNMGEGGSRETAGWNQDVMSKKTTGFFQF